MTDDSDVNHLREIMDERDRRYEQRFDNQDKAVRAALASQQEAVKAALTAADRATTKAEQAADKRFDSTNEFRGQLSDQAATFITRAESLALINRNNQDIQELKDRINSSSGEAKGSQLSKANLYAGLAAVATGLGIIVLLANTVFK